MSGEHRCIRQCVRTGYGAYGRDESGSQARTALAATSVDDGTAGTCAHAQTETVHTRAPTVVRLKGPLALGHGELLVVGAPERTCVLDTRLSGGLMPGSVVSERIHHDRPLHVTTRSLRAGDAHEKTHTSATVREY